MKKKKIFSFFAAALAFGLVACNNDGDGTANADSLNNEDGNTVTTTTTTQNDYTALADTFRTNSEAGNYLDPKTGKSIRINVDPQSGARINAETGEPVWRYVDRRNWWVYSGDETNMMWDTVGQARMENNRIMYRGDNDTWRTYDDNQTWRTEDDNRNKSWKTKVGDTKIKVSKDGDIKIKDEKGKVKYDADDNKIKTDSSD